MFDAEGTEAPRLGINFAAEESIDALGSDRVGEVDVKNQKNRIKGGTTNAARTVDQESGSSIVRMRSRKSGWEGD